MRCFVLIMWLFSSLLSQAQQKPGLYLTLNYEMEICDNQVPLINTDKVYCLSEEPVMDLNLFESVDELVYDSVFEMRRFRIVLTDKGQDYVSTISRKLPGHNLALVVNGLLISIIDLEGINHPRSIIIWDKNDTQAMEWVHRTLVRSVTRNTKKS